MALLSNAYDALQRKAERQRELEEIGQRARGNIIYQEPFKPRGPGVSIGLPFGGGAGYQTGPGVPTGGYQPTPSPTYQLTPPTNFRGGPGGMFTAQEVAPGGGGGGVLSDIGKFITNNPELVTGLAATGVDIYGAVQEGKARDRQLKELERQARAREEEARKRREDERVLTLLGLMARGPGRF